MQWPVNWEPVSPEARQALETELSHEVLQKHPLCSVRVEAIARRYDCDEVLFAPVGSLTVVAVHLSYRKDAGVDWPDTQLYSSLSEWAEQEKAE